MLKSELRKVVDRVLEDHEVEDKGLASDLVEEIASEAGGDIMDDDGDDEPAFLGEGKDD